MNGIRRHGNHSHTFTIYILALLLAIVWVAVAAAQAPQIPGPGGPSTGPSGTQPNPTSTSTPTPRPSPTPTGSGGDNLPGDPTGGDGDDNLPGDPTGGTDGDTPTLAQVLAEYELIKALAPNRIIFHAATPIQLCKAEDGLQIYYIGRDGKTRLGPYVPSFAELAAKYPAGDEASIYFGFNPLTGKRVKIDYLPAVKRIRVDTFYADRENDINKQYIFHFGPEHDITYDAW